MSTLPDLEGWAIFSKVASEGSFARAAQELQLSQATVSKTIARLERRLHTSLLHRTSRRLSLTDAGRAALDGASRMLEEAEAVEAELIEQAASLRGTIRLSAPMSFGLSHLAALLPDFMSRHPHVELDVEFSDQMADLVAHRFDLALRISRLADSSLLARRLCGIRVLLVGAPVYFERHGHPQHPRDLAGHRALQYAYAPKGTSWHFRHARHGEFTQVMATPLRMNNAEGLMPALRAGLGLALQPEFIVWPDLQSGALQATMGDWQLEPIALHIVTPPGRRRPARVQALIEYLAEHFTQAPWARAHSGP